MDLFIEGLKGVSKALRFQLFVQKDILELGNHSVEDGGSDLGRVDL